MSEEMEKSPSILTVHLHHVNVYLDRPVFPMFNLPSREGHILFQYLRGGGYWERMG